MILLYVIVIEVITKELQVELPCGVGLYRRFHLMAKTDTELCEKIVKCKSRYVNLRSENECLKRACKKQVGNNSIVCRSTV